MKVFAIPVLLPFMGVERPLVLARVVALVALELLVRSVLPLVRDQLRVAPGFELSAYIALQYRRRIFHL